ncbi:T-cell immunoglobulin and mucin domain-containing protein 4 isoform X2 [Esox lucius]|uniref:T-cell immunoglobulin and mucin domain-containing protein 4 isoform X2 n=1 Tax=Esox lucius TaxID=8010 RepID=UPI0014773CA5|nr:T-cell immunoglobulin and mucin domain-containing protein 4 isoform X2 [Esox lucius]
MSQAVAPENTAAHSDALSLHRPACARHDTVSCVPHTPAHWMYAMAAGSVPSFLRLILVLLTVSARCSVSAFRVMEGATATLSCQYSVSRWGLKRVCWGRECGTFWCNDILVQTDENGVISKVSDRYRLHGDIFAGEMDLGILDVKRTDSGPYCCRVDINGFFNDIKVVQNLRVMKAPVAVTTTSAVVNNTDARPVTDHWRAVESSHLAILRQNTSVSHSGTLVENPPPSLSLQINIPVLSLSISLLILITGALVILGFKRGIHRRALKTGCLSAKEPPHIIYEIRLRRPVEENIYTLD